MQERLLCEGLILAQSLENDSVCTLAEHLDLSIRRANDGGHAFARGVKLADIKDFVLH